MSKDTPMADDTEECVCGLLRGSAKHREEGPPGTGWHPFVPRSTPAASERMTAEQEMILRWLSKEDFSSLGECDGIALRELVRRGLAKIAPTNRGGGFDLVSVTEEGWAWLESNPVGDRPYAAAPLPQPDRAKAGEDVTDAMVDAANSVFEAAEARAERARALLEAIAEHPSANAIILPSRDGKPMIGAGTAAKDAIRALRTAPPPTAKEG